MRAGRKGDYIQAAREDDSQERSLLKAIYICGGRATLRGGDGRATLSMC